MHHYVRTDDFFSIIIKNIEKKKTKEVRGEKKFQEGKKWKAQECYFTFQ